MHSLEEVKRAVEEGVPCVVPLVKSMRSDLRPTDVYATMRKGCRYSFLLESAEIGEKIARYSFLGGKPSKILRLKDNNLCVNGRTARIKGNPLAKLRKMMNYRVAENKLPRFFGGLLGYFSYDFVRYFENIGNRAKDDLNQNDAELMLVTDVVAFDHLKEELLLISSLLIEKKSEIGEKYEEGIKKIAELEEIVRRSTRQERQRNERSVRISSNFTKEGFEKAVKRVKEYIYAGDIFQAVLSQRFECDVRSNPFDIYLALKEINPSPYMYFLEFDDLKIVGSSPEILVKTEGRKGIVRPIAGTRPRGGDIVEDEKLCREMLNDPKERAEHVMLVDLGRNDIGKISKFGSVVVDDFMAVEKYSHVQHIVSNVVGELEDKKDALDAVEATFPAGTVSGAPKVRAMEIIDELEPSRRGIYAGSVGYFSFNLNTDFAITIRTIIFKGKKAYIQAGAGIVADSVPEREHQETVNKGRAMIRAIELAGG